jgi:hypothetical protein
MPRKCEQEGCMKQSYFNYEDQTKARFCGDHRLPGMLDIKNKRCEHEGCRKYPIFNYDGQTKGRFCGDHRLPGMMNIKSKRCEQEGCRKYPIFNYDGQKGGRFCGDHRLPGMMNVNHKACIAEHCVTRACNPRYRGYCLPCFMGHFPNEPVCRNYKTKERAVAESVQTAFNDVTWSYDKLVPDGCSKRRPDIFGDFGDFVIIIEVDEFSHEGYSCEHKRLMEISQDIGHRPLIVIRFNPDSYVSNGVKYTCWRHDGNGILVVSRSKAKEWRERLTTQNHEIQKWMQTKSEKTLQVVHLFYGDGVK